MKKRETHPESPNAASPLEKAFWNAFPSVASFKSFLDEDRDIAISAKEAIIAYAFSRHVIAQATEAAFIDFLNKTRSDQAPRSLPAGLTFPEILDILCEGSSANALIRQMEIVAMNLSLPVMSAAMMTRLKKSFVVNTSRKRAHLRTLAFVLAIRRPDLNWNYELLAGLSGQTTKEPLAVDSKAGVTAVFHLHSQGDMILSSDVDWLRDELVACLNDLRAAGHIAKKKVEAIAATSYMLRSPKAPGSPNEPGLYTRAIRNILAITHQLSVRWMLSARSTPRKRLIVLISVGKFTDDHQRFVPMLPSEPADDSGIYLTDMARLCAGVADIRASFERRNPDYTHESLMRETLWTVTDFWPNHAYDYIPCLLKKHMLPLSNDDASFEDFLRALHFPEERAQSPFEALTAMNRFPQSPILLLEIAKVLRGRQMLHEADTVLSHLLLSNPDHLSARFMRMLTYCNAADMASDDIAAQLAFDRAMSEGRYIVERLPSDSETWSALGLLLFSRAAKRLRDVKGRLSSSVRKALKADILALLKEAETCLLTGLAASSSGQAVICLFWLTYTQGLTEAITTDDTFFKASHLSFPVDHKDSFRKAGIRVLRKLGWISQDALPHTDVSRGDLDRLWMRARLNFSLLEKIMLGRSYTPYLKCLFAFLLWDFYPRIDETLRQTVISLFELARRDAEKLIADCLCVYKAPAGYIPALQFIAQVDGLLALLGDKPKKHSKKASSRGEAACEDLFKLKLMLLDFNRPTQTDNL